MKRLLIQQFASDVRKQVCRMFNRSEHVFLFSWQNLHKPLVRYQIEKYSHIVLIINLCFFTWLPCASQCLMFFIKTVKITLDYWYFLLRTSKLGLWQPKHGGVANTQNSTKENQTHTFRWPPAGSGLVVWMLLPATGSWKRSKNFNERLPETVWHVFPLL